MRYIDIVRSIVRNAQANDVPALTWDEQKHHINAIRQKIDDIEIVVRCKDCKWAEKAIFDEYCVECTMHHTTFMKHGFCNHGERRESTE